MHRYRVSHFPVRSFRAAGVGLDTASHDPQHQPSSAGPGLRSQTASVRTAMWRRMSVPTGRCGIISAYSTTRSPKLPAEIGAGHHPPQPPWRRLRGQRSMQFRTDSCRTRVCSRLPSPQHWLRCGGPHQHQRSPGDQPHPRHRPSLRPPELLTSGVTVAAMSWRAWCIQLRLSPRATFEITTQWRDRRRRPWPPMWRAELYPAAW